MRSSPNIIRLIKARRITRAGHVARMGRRGIYTGFGGKARRKVEGLAWNGLIWLRIRTT
jgi:hypothetical protein